MSLFRLSERAVICGAMAALLCAAVPAAAQQKGAPPDFSSNGVAWVGLNGNGPSFAAVPGLVPPVTQDPAHPFVPNGVGRTADLPDRRPQQSEPKALGEGADAKGQ